MGEDSLRALLTNTRFADARVVDSIDSTNRALLQWSAAGLDDHGRPVHDGSVLIARTQSAGRGRLGRRWVAPIDSALLMSVLVRPAPLPIEHWPLLSFAMGVAVVEAARLAGASPVALKWPNDVVVSDPSSGTGYRKMAGILAESSFSGGVGSVVVGVGVNLHRPAQTDPELGPEAIPTWLDDHAGPFEPEAFTAAVLRCFERQLALLTDSVPSFLDGYRMTCLTLGQQVRAELGDASLVGVALDVDPAGHLLVRTPDATLHTLNAGDVVHLRPAG